jgi:hypothetical protein
MAKEFVDKTRTGIPGVPGLSKVVNRNAWGEAKALERTKDYGGGGTRTFPPPEDVHAPQRLGDKNNLQDNPTYRNDTPNNWLRGAGGSAEGKPSFDSRGKDGAPKKW